MDRTSTCNGDGTTAETPKKSRSGKSNWANFNEKRKRDALRRKGIPSHRLNGKQPLQPKPLQPNKTVRKSTRVIQRAIRLESPLPFSESETEDANNEGNFEDDDSSSDERLDDRHCHDYGLSLDGDSLGAYARLGLLSGCVSPEEFTN